MPVYAPPLVVRASLLEGRLWRLLYIKTIFMEVTILVTHAVNTLQTERACQAAWVNLPSRFSIILPCQSRRRLLSAELICI